MPNSEPEHGLARENLCRLLAACYYEPGPEFAEEGLFESMAIAAAKVNEDLAAPVRRLGAAFAAEDLETLLVDYTRLFLGPVHILAKPYASVWLEQKQELMQESTMALLELYAEGGFDMSEDFRELPDHVAAELEFLYLLIFKENQARRDADGQALAVLADLRQRFLSQHLAKWIAAFSTAVEAGAQTAFYRELGPLTRRLVELEVALPYDIH